MEIRKFRKFELHLNNGAIIPLTLIEDREAITLPEMLAENWESNASSIHFNRKDIIIPFHAISMIKGIK